MNLKRITLYSAGLRNDGGYLDAGSTIDVGDGDNQVDTDRAKQLIDEGRAVSETAAKADEKAGGDAALELDRPIERPAL